MSSAVNNNTNTTNTGSTSNTPAAAQTGLSSNYADFLKLLTTQLQNQDPTAPADTNQVTQEIAMLSQVQQQIDTNTNLQQLITMFSASQTNNAVSYIGKQVDATGNQGNLSNGIAVFGYTLPAGAVSSTVTITDSTGKTVFSGAGTTLAGRNEVYWNGVNSTTGATMPDGTYNIAVTAKDSSGKAVTATTLTTGTVTSVDTQNGTATLDIGGISVPMANVQSVRTPVTFTAAPPATDSGTDSSSSSNSNSTSSAAA